MDAGPDENTDQLDQARVHFLDSGHLDITADVIQLSNEPPSANITPIMSHDTSIDTPLANEFSVVYTLNLLIFNSFLGTLIRLCLNNLFSYDEEQVFPLIYAQMVGSFLFGFLYKSQKTLLKNNANLFIGFGTGLCGCITTFSSFMLQTFNYLFHINSTIGVLQGILNAITIIVITLTASLASLKYGKLLGNHFNQYRLLKLPTHDKQTNDPPKSPKSNHILHDTFIKFSLLFLVSFVPWSLIIVTSIWIPQGRNWTIALAISPFGTLLRMLLKRLNNLRSKFYWGTFVANILGTGILGMIYIFKQPQLGYCTVKQQWVCDLLFGFSDGFCACLTTISAFVFELHQLNSKRAHQYGIISIVSGQVILLFIVGSWYWTNGINQ